jgi:fructokinase
MTEKKYDVTALGELLIDFTENGSSSQGNVLMEANPGALQCAGHAGKAGQTDGIYR